MCHFRKIRKSLILKAAETEVKYFDLTADMKQKQKTVSNNVSRKILMKLLHNKVW